MIEIQERGYGFEAQESLASKNISKILGVKSTYEKVQYNVIEELKIRGIFD